jgi:DNA-binding NarL/FixJ family response regulator
MDTRRTVVLYGASLFIAGMEACLRNRPGLDVVRVNAEVPGERRRLAALQPDAIIFDWDDASLGGLPGITQLLRDSPGVRIIGLDLTSNAVTILSGQQQLVTRVEDVADAIRAGTAGG